MCVCVCPVTLRGCLFMLTITFRGSFSPPCKLVVLYTATRFVFVAFDRNKRLLPQ